MVPKKKPKIALPGAPEKSPFKLDRDFPFQCSGPLLLRERTIERLHIHDVFEVGLCLEGKGIFVIEDKVFSFGAGDVFIINHLEMHRACMPDGRPSRWHFLMMDPLALLSPGAASPEVADTRLFSGKDFPNQFRQKEHPRIFGRVEAMIREAGEKSLYYRENIKALLLLLLVDLFRFMKEKAPKQTGQRTGRTFSLMGRLSPALEKIAGSYAEPLTVESLARLCFMGTGHFRRLFGQAFRKSPLDFLNDYRIAMICSQLKTTDRSVTDIAMSCGFSTLSCFNRQFRKRKRCSPREWRGKSAAEGQG
jgi:AraC-like DNA-binding protein